jgi:hypothetical protein
MKTPRLANAAGVSARAMAWSEANGMRNHQVFRNLSGVVVQLGTGVPAL